MKVGNINAAVLPKIPKQQRLPGEQRSTSYLEPGKLPSKSNAQMFCMATG
jgi:hypothetical protein